MYGEIFTLNMIFISFLSNENSRWLPPQDKTSTYIFRGEMIFFSETTELFEG